MGELETEREKSRAEIADHLRGLADQLESGGPITLELGGSRVELDPKEPIVYKLEGESDWQQGEPTAKQSIEFELVWRRDVGPGEDASLSVETSPTGPQ